MNVILYNNSKRLNSTGTPPAALITYDCVLKESCSLLQPSLRIKSTTKPAGNYMQFEGRYYWITDIISIANDLWQITGKVDVLTTYRSHIFNTQAFVLYDSTPNTQLPDNRLGIETDCTAYTSTANMPWYFSTGDGSGTYIIATTGNTDRMDLITLQDIPDDRVGTGVYTIPQNQLKKLGFDLSDWVTGFNTIWNTFNDRKDYINQNYFVWTTDPYQNIANFFRGFSYMVENGIDYVSNFFRLFASNILGSSSALSNIKASYWLPFTVPNTATAAPAARYPTHLALGNYTDVITGLREIVDPIITAVGVDVSIPWQFSDWRNAACTEVMLYIPLIGCINIPSDVLKGNDSLSLKFSLNLYSGALACEVTCGGAQIGTYGADCAMPILIGDSNIDTGAIINTLGSAVTKNYVGAGTNALMSFNEMVSSVGGLGGGAGVGLSNQIVCICRVHETSQDPAALLPVIGTPTRQLKTLSQGLGYCQTLNAQVRLTGSAPIPTETEIEEINNLLNTGVYLE